MLCCNDVLLLSILDNIVVSETDVIAPSVNLGAIPVVDQTGYATCVRETCATTSENVKVMFDGF